MREASTKPRQVLTKLIIIRQRLIRKVTDTRHRSTKRPKRKLKVETAQFLSQPLQSTINRSLIRGETLSKGWMKPH